MPPLKPSCEERFIVPVKELRDIDGAGQTRVEMVRIEMRHYLWLARNNGEVFWSDQLRSEKLIVNYPM